MAHKNILIGLSGGQLFSLDHRMIHPRRPVGTPTLGEREEGLMQYNPFIPIIPQNAVTLDTRITGEAIHVVTAAGTYVPILFRNILLYDISYHWNTFLNFNTFFVFFIFFPPLLTSFLSL